MVAFVTLDDYGAMFGAVPPGSVDQVTFALDAACEDIRRYTSQQLSYVANDTVTVHGNNMRVLLLPEVPVVAVTAVTVDGDALEVGDWTVDAGTGLLWRQPQPLTTCLFPLWTDGVQNVTVTYSHGYQVMPSNLKRIACALARDVVNSTSAATAGVKSETIGNYSYTLTDEAAASGVGGATLEPYRFTLDLYVQPA
jgi:hypothetical protein